MEAPLRFEDNLRLEALQVPEPSRRPIATWLDLLRQWNARMDLTAARTDEELFDLMLADAVVLAGHGDARSSSPLLPPNARVVDVGSGAGAPGLALALLRPDLEVTLVEPLTKRVSFLRTVLGSLGRTDVVLRRERAQELVMKDPRPGWDVAISRATLPPAVWIPVGLDLAPTAWVLLAREEPPELDGFERRGDVPYVWPLTKVERRAVSYQRISLR